MVALPSPPTRGTPHSICPEERERNKGGHVISRSCLTLAALGAYAGGARFADVDALGGSLLVLLVVD